LAAGVRVGGRGPEVEEMTSLILILKQTLISGHAESTLYERLKFKLDALAIGARKGKQPSQ
jgi:hypothetical protein